MQEMVFPGLLDSNIFRRECPHTPRGWSVTLPTLIGSAAHIRIYWNPWDGERSVYLHSVEKKVSANWGTWFTVDSQSLARDTCSFSRQRFQWPTTSVLFLGCLTASSLQIVILRFCCAKILGYKAHPNFSTNLPPKDRFFLKKPCAL